jgi:hypothetical protein
MGYVLPKKPEGMSREEYLAALERAYSQTWLGRLQWRLAARAVERGRREYEESVAELKRIVGTAREER